MNIATASTRRARTWKNETLTWDEFCDRIAEPVRTNETLKEFLRLGKEQQGDIKDVGGYVGGYLRQGKRSPQTVAERSILTLDVDFAGSDFFDSFTLMYGCAAVVHATHKHQTAEPRYRLLIPLSRACTPDEYGAVARRVAGDMGIDMFDNTTFEINRLMFWPSHPKDVEYYMERQRGDLLDVDHILASYLDWTDTSLWPTADKVISELGEKAKKQQDPLSKSGLIGAFCRTYSIGEAVDVFLSEIYTEAQEGRYSYVKGSTSSGVVVYDDMFSYSHHGTDPAGGQLCNAFDLVRLHLFADLDTTPQGRKSFEAMERLASEDKGVRSTLAHEAFEDAGDVFDIETSELDLTWMEQLQVNTKGAYLSSAENLNLVFENDRFLASAFKRNEFDGLRYICKSVPWRKVPRAEPFRNVDYSGIRNYIECIYGISAQMKVDDSLALEIEKNSFHPIREYLNSLEWDGVSRLETTLCDYFGAEDSSYTRQTFRKWMSAAVSRVFRPGCKFDTALILVDPEQGSAKSSFFAALGQEWFSDTFMTVHGKEALEQLQGAWIIEMAELAGLRKAEVESTKHFISKQEDRFRPAYARTPETFKRQCVFAGTTNNRSFLRDTSGNRRYWPVDVIRSEVKKSVFDDLPNEVDQLWAEAVQLVQAGETLYLSSEVEAEAFKQQMLHTEVDERMGVVDAYLDIMLPENWKGRDPMERRNYIEEGVEGGTVARQYVCIAEVWVECLGNKKEDMSKYNTREINELMRMLPNWEVQTGTKGFPPYGMQRYYKRVKNQ